MGFTPDQCIQVQDLLDGIDIALDLEASSLVRMVQADYWILHAPGLDLDASTGTVDWLLADVALIRLSQ
jgi:hypothetical protein